MSLDIANFQPRAEIQKQLNETNFIGLIGPSAIGKNALIMAMGGIDYDFSKIVSSTTRLPRKDEVEGKDYNFVSPYENSSKDVEQMLAEADLVQIAQHPTTGVYYWSTLDQWTKTPFVALDVQTKAFEDIEKSLELKTSIPVVVATELQEWLRRFELRSESISIDEKEKRLAEASISYTWALGRESVHWVLNNDNRLYEAASTIINIAHIEAGGPSYLYEGNYTGNSAQKYAEEILEYVDKQLR